MKRTFALLLCLSLSISLLAFPASATSVLGDGQLIVSQTIEYIGNDCYYVETISVPAIQSLSNSKTGTKTAQCIISGKTIFTISVTGIFTYDGVSSEATSASGSISTYVEDATINGGSAYTSGSSAIATGSVVYLGFTLQKTVTLTCDKDGNLT